MRAGLNDCEGSAGPDLRWILSDKHGIALYRELYTSFTYGNHGAMFINNVSIQKTHILGGNVYMQVVRPEHHLRGRFGSSDAVLGYRCPADITRCH